MNYICLAWANICFIFWDFVIKITKTTHFIIICLHVFNNTRECTVHIWRCCTTIFTLTYSWKKHQNMIEYASYWINHLTWVALIKIHRHLPNIIRNNNNNNNGSRLTYCKDNNSSRITFYWGNNGSRLTFYRDNNSSSSNSWSITNCNLSSSNNINGNWNSSLRISSNRIRINCSNSTMY